MNYRVKQYDKPCEYLVDRPNSAECGNPATFKKNGHYFCADCMEAADKRIAESGREVQAYLDPLKNEPIEEL